MFNTCTRNFGRANLRELPRHIPAATPAQANAGLPRHVVPERLQTLVSGDVE